MHQQIRTSPDEVADNLKHVVDALAGAEINVEGIGPDFESPHIRTVVNHDRVSDAIAALEAASLQPELRPAFTRAVANRPGGLKGILDDLEERGYAIESVLVLATRPHGQVLVSIGTDPAVPSDWEELGGWVEESHPDD
jgi:hypothetical protein